MAHILMHAELDGVICSGPRRDRHFTYALLDERAPAAARLERDEALVQLALRYFRSHGPATAHDFSWWSGLTVTDARRAAAACGPHLREHAIDGAMYWSDAEVIESTPIGGVRLLPNFDEHTVAYRNHAPSFHSSAPGSIGRANGGVGLHVVLSDGYVVGVWQRLFARASCSVRVQLFRALTRTEAAGLEDAAGSYARFLELPVTLAIEP
jgi:hypothetical protein